MTLVALTMLSCFQFAKAQSTASKLLVNEIMARNIDMMIDPSYNYGGWIELYNPTNSPISKKSQLCKLNFSQTQHFLLTLAKTQPELQPNTAFFAHFG